MKIKKNVIWLICVFICMFPMSVHASEIMEQIDCYIYDTGDENEDNKVTNLTLELVDNLVLPVKCDAKGIIEYIAYKNNLSNLETQDLVKFEVFKDSQCSEKMNIENENNIFGIYTGRVKIHDPNIVYFKISNLTKETISLKLQLSMISSENRNIISGRWLNAYDMDNTYSYFRFNVMEDSKVDFNMDTSKYYNDNILQFEICDKNKKIISKSYKLSNKLNHKEVCLKKGTYYFKIKVLEGKEYRIKYDLGKLSKNSGSKRANSRKIKNNKIYVGYQIIGEKKSDWYSFKSKTTNSCFSIECNADSKLFNINIYDSKGKKMPYSSEIVIQNNKLVGKYEVNTKSKGAYYIEILKSNIKDSAEYRFKVW